MKREEEKFEVRLIPDCTTLEAEEALTEVMHIIMESLPVSES